MKLGGRVDCVGAVMPYLYRRIMEVVMVPSHTSVKDQFMPFLTASIFRRAAFLAALISASLVHADCVDTVGLTPLEKDFYQRANAALKSLLRPPPLADKLWSADSMTSPGHIQVCKNDKKPGHFTVAVSRKYVWPDPKGNAADSVVTLRLAINAPSFGARVSKYSGAFGSPSPNLSAGLRVSNVVWELAEGGYGIPALRESLRASLADGLDLLRMEKMVGRALPSIAESETLAINATPADILVAPASQAVGTPTNTSPAEGTQAAANSSPTASAIPAASAPAVPAEPSAVERAKELGNAVQKLRGLFGQ